MRRHLSTPLGRGPCRPRILAPLTAPALAVLGGVAGAQAPAGMVYVESNLGGPGATSSMFLVLPSPDGSRPQGLVAF
jgi:hypothetical protein